MDEETRDNFDKIYMMLAKIEVQTATNGARMEGMRSNIRIGHMLLFAIIAGVTGFVIM